MPIYAYRCDACGHGRDVLQKMSDAPLTDCTSCGAKGTFKKQLTAAGFQLKGSGWYVTDFRGGNSGTSAAPATAAAGSATEGKSDAAAPASSGAATDSSSTVSTAPTSTAGGSGSAVASH
ncbi:FmdB family zinc ribbon protein [Cupriavidus basilensis]|uniref:Zinc ribbon domain-containing protein n=1 Tax=Cupriavidus basilensis TaxID=68895 RepID=A0A643FQI3_9BURK|nr:FmdB family zinc ribbon protein [Cupriavidus basilensis]MCP3024637.1 zinc ribbon domain-containing protein [Cupriavidus basilensis]MDR3384511.1 zinc ribbon domain-containing protein [Cupriavidus basilensis]QOT77000.1 zinc ribbon domain-containing protein [Cupriavidus basilensis]